MNARPSILEQAQATIDARLHLHEAKQSLEHCFASELPDAIEAPDELVRGLFVRKTLNVIYGDSNSGKTFCAISLVGALCDGVKWMGRETEACLVVYLASEGPPSVKRRVQAYKRHFDVKLANLVIVSSPIDLYSASDDTLAVVRLVRELETLTGIKCGLIVGDTLARMSPGAQENSSEDMGVVVKHSDVIVKETGAAFLLIHHTGKDAARGMRGWSGLRAAVDTEIEITADELTGLHAAEITKQRDLPTKGDRIGFKLEQVTLGLTKWGWPLTSCVAVPADAPAKKQQARRTSEIAGAIAELLTARGTGIRKGDLVKHFDGRYDKSGVYRELKRMQEDGKVHEVAGVVALVRS